ncbi:MAG: molybdopterin-dependent oxidoreductase, partial [Planctomycetales bacterium]
ERFGKENLFWDHGTSRSLPADLFPECFFSRRAAVAPCTRDRLKSPLVRFSDGELHEITWDQLYEVMARLVVKATEMEKQGHKIKVKRPQGLGVKLYEYQYLENTYAATKFFYSAVGTPNVAYHDRPSAAGSSPGLSDVGFRPHDFSYDEVRKSDVLLFLGTNPYENQSVFFMQYCTGKEMIVLDPRQSATAQYARQTGGLHVQPKRLGADSLVLYALAREVIRRWIAEDPNNHSLKNFPLRDDVATLPAAIAQLEAEANSAKPGKEKNAKMRRASRAMTFEDFAEFLQIDNAASRYTIENAAKVAGLEPSVLHEVVSRIWDERAFTEPTDDGTPTTRTRRPRVGVMYEKGLIWGFNYHNTSSVGSLGLLLGAYSEPGKFVGRVGGHQKGWAESKADLSGRFENAPADASHTEGYPFRNVTDRYSDAHLRKLFGKDAEIKVHHNIDNQVFGPDPAEIVSAEGDRVVLRNNLTTDAEPNVRLLWIIGNNYLGQTNDAARKREVLQRRLRVGGRGGRIRRPEPVAAKQLVNEIVKVLGDRMDAGGIVCVHQELFANPTTEFCDLVIPAAGWGEDDFCRYNAQR